MEIKRKKLIKTPLIFFPGTLCDERIFIPLWRALNTDTIHLEHKAYVPLQWAEDLTQMIALGEDRLDYFPSKVHLIGFSMGAYVASHIALANPEKVASLTLLNGTATSLQSHELAKRNALLASLKTKKYKGMSDASIEAMFYEGNHKNALMTSTIKEMAHDLGPSVLLAQTKATTIRNELITGLSKQAFMTHFLTGEQDIIATPTQISDIVASSSTFSSRVFSKAGHMLPIEQPAALAKHLHHTLK